MNRLTPLALAAALVLAFVPSACTEVGTDPDVATELQFDTLPFSAIVLGDSLADDTLGASRPLEATAFNSRRDELPDAPIYFFPVRNDLGIVVDSVTGHVFADSAAAAVPLDTVLARGAALYARVGRLQSQTRSLIVTRRPDSLAAIDPLIDTLELTAGPADTLMRFGAFNVRLLHLDAAGAVRDSVRGWPVRFRLLDATGAPADTGKARLIDDGDRPSTVDTTEVGGSEGRAGRRVRVRQARFAAFPDTLFLEADAWYDGARVRGAPVRFTLILRLKPTS